MKRLLYLIPIYGSFKDINVLWELTDSSKLKQDIIDLYTLHLRKDELQFDDDSKLSLAAKWAPRESGHYRDMARALANNYLKEHTCSQKKIYSEYRKMISSINKRLNTTEIHMAGKTWQDINPTQVPSRCLMINRDAFQNKIQSFQWLS